MLLFISKKILPVLAFAAAVFLGVKYLLPVVFPFLVGAGVALLAEPLVRPVGQKAGRPLGAALGVSLTLAVLSGVVVLVGAVAVQQVGRLAGAMPQMADTAMKSMDTLKLWLSDLSAKALRNFLPAAPVFSSKWPDSCLGQSPLSSVLSAAVRCRWEPGSFPPF